MTQTTRSGHKQSLIKDIPLTALGWELALPIFGGALIGYLIDRQWNTQYGFTIGLLLLGIALGYYNLYKHIEIEMLRLKRSKQTHPPEESST